MTRRPVATMTAPPFGIGMGALNAWAVRFRYNAELVELLKTVIDWRERTWDAVSRCWYVDHDAVDYLIDAMRAEGVTVRLIGADGRPITDTGSAGTGTAGDPPPAWAQPSWAETLLTVVGPDRRDAVFRALSKVLHPDTETGNNELMRELIVARELVTER